MSIKIRDGISQLLRIGASVNVAEMNVFGLDLECKKAGERAFDVGICVLFSKRIPATTMNPGIRPVSLSENAHNYSDNRLGTPATGKDGQPITAELGCWVYYSDLPSWVLAAIEGRVAVEQEKGKDIERAGGTA